MLVQEAGTGILVFEIKKHVLILFPVCFVGRSKGKARQTAWDI